jgi:hypothetical protein
MTKFHTASYEVMLHGESILDKINVLFDPTANATTNSPSNAQFDRSERSMATVGHRRSVTCWDAISGDVFLRNRTMEETLH